MIEQAKILRVFQLIGLLKSGGRTVGQLADHLKTTDRTIYRYFKLLEQVGFAIDQDFSGRYFIHRDEIETLDDRFTLDELDALRNVVQTSSSKAIPQESILRKLAFHSEVRELPGQFLKMRLAKLFRMLNEAMESKKQVILKSYHSANSQQITDRQVEPFQFGEGFQSVLALDTKDKQCKFFKLERIGEVIITEKKFRYEKLHERTRTDSFGISGKKETWVTLRLSMRAYVLLREEFPLATRYLEKDPRDAKTFAFNGPVLGFKGVGRFVMGLADEITVVNPPEFKTYIKEKLKGQKLV